MPRFLLLIASSLVALALAACGGDDDSDSGLPTGDVSKEEYIAEVDQICADANAQIQSESQAFFEQQGLREDQQPTPEQLEQFVDEVLVPSLNEQVDRLRSVEAPEADAEQLASLYDDVEAAGDQISENPELLLGEEDPFADVDQRARDYGFEVCGSS